MTRSVILRAQRRNPGMFLNWVGAPRKVQADFTNPLLLLQSSLYICDVVDWQTFLQNVLLDIFLWPHRQLAVYIPHLGNKTKTTRFVRYGARSDSNATHNTVDVRKSNTCAKCRRLNFSAATTHKHCYNDNSDSHLSSRLQSKGRRHRTRESNAMHRR